MEFIVTIKMEIPDGQQPVHQFSFDDLKEATDFVCSYLMHANFCTDAHISKTSAKY